ncbi:MAG: 16S rRNA (cytidine(1402)-2'-O)-methyltransferase [Actinomycetales bacterium]|nr:16S rRNA (cytidine(1402)-2'-O)-methyltransferase [Actinomycetales bacterium]
MGELVIAAVPLGNINDASDHLKSAITKADVILAEDSRRFMRLCKDLGIEYRATVISFFEGNEKERLDDLLRSLQESKNILLLTDAGMPTISDPGYRAIRLAIDGGFTLRVIPGPSAVTTALALSGLPTDRFCFEGFVPRTEGARQNRFEELALEERTMIFFEAPHRITEFIATARQVFGDERRAALCREMTKQYEETIRGTLKELAEWSLSKEMLGEFTIVIAGFDPSHTQLSEEEIAEKVKSYERSGITRKEAISMVAVECKVAKRKVFDIMVEYK